MPLYAATVFLSAFLLASEVTLTTRSFQGGGALRWHSAGDEHYEIVSGERDEVGTTVELRVKPAAAFVLNERNLEEAVRTYADFLPIPIHVQDDERVIIHSESTRLLVERARIARVVTTSGAQSSAPTP